MTSPPMLLYKVSKFFHGAGLRRTSNAVAWFNRFCFGCWIPGSIECDGNFKVGYWGIGVVIHSDTKIGDGSLICQNVTIGRNFGDKSVPTIGKNVYIGAGSVVFGEIHIGDNAIIAANSTVTRSIAPNMLVMGSPGKPVREQPGGYKAYDQTQSD